MKLVCTVDIMNRLAQSVGYGSQSKLRKPCKSVLQIRNKPNGGRVLVVSTSKDISGQEYVLNNVNLRTRFVDEGRATIEVDKPPFNVMLRGCNPDQLREFMDMITQPSEGKHESGVRASAPSQKPLVPASDQKEQSESEEVGSLRKSSGGLKRPRSPELSKTATAKIKKCLLINDKVLTVMNRENYPKEFPLTLEKLTIRNIGLRMIDKRLFRLKWLTVLNLSGNRLKDVDKLMKLSASLQSLTLASNEIDNLQWNFFSNPAFRGLTHLDLSRNKLAVLPSSVVDLHCLKVADFSDNRLACLPYNWIRMKSLQSLNVSSNRLTFLPAVIPYLRIMKLDISNNRNLHVQIPIPNVATYVGYSDIPTLFESAIEVLKTTTRKSVFATTGLPDIVYQYMNGCKYCMPCGRMTLKYKINSFSALTSLAIETVQSSGQRGLCVLKQIVCDRCDKSRVNARAMLP